MTPKKDNMVRFVSDLRELNAVIKKTQYPSPIQDVLRRRGGGYSYLSKLDISMQFYTVASMRRVANSYNRNIEDIEIYIDDIGVFTDSWEKHLAILTQVLSRLEEHGFTVNPRKCEWGVKKID